MENLHDAALNTLISSLEKKCTPENLSKACRWILSHPEAHPYVFAGAAVVIMGLSLCDSIAIGEANYKLFLERIESIQIMHHKEDQKNQYQLLQEQLALWKRERQFRGAVKIGVGIGLVIMAFSAALAPVIRFIVGGSGTVTAGAGVYDLCHAYDPKLYQELEIMLRSKGYLKDE